MVGAVRESSGRGRERPTAETVRRWLQDVADPEIPVISVVDLGIVRHIEVHDDGVEVSVTPTYIGCPATEVIERLIEQALLERGAGRVSVRRVMSPAWTTDWISDAGRKKLEAYGIAPPEPGGGKRGLLSGQYPVACPRCRETDTSRVSEFGSTPCKASYRCNACAEPFEHFKCI